MHGGVRVFEGGRVADASLLHKGVTNCEVALLVQVLCYDLQPSSHLCECPRRTMISSQLAVDWLICQASPDR